MREIKFRAWHSGNLEMEFGVWVGGGTAGFFDSSPPSPFRFNDRVEVMQYTGVKDKNGVEIYEGDILAPMENDFKPKWKGNWIVTFRDGAFVAKCERGTADHWLPYWEGNLVEVIGNIHENPELLK